MPPPTVFNMGYQKDAVVNHPFVLSNNCKSWWNNFKRQLDRFVKFLCIETYPVKGRGGDIREDKVAYNIWSCLLCLVYAGEGKPLKSVVSARIADNFLLCFSVFQ